MLIKIDHSKKAGNSHISILYSGLYLSETDTGYYSISRLDQANTASGVVIKMPPHVDNDILTYFRRGKVKHSDSEGVEELIPPHKLTLMKAGKMFLREESVHDNVEALQI